MNIPPKLNANRTPYTARFASVRSPVLRNTPLVKANVIWELQRDFGGITGKGSTGGILSHAHTVFLCNLVPSAILHNGRHC